MTKSLLARILCLLLLLGGSRVCPAFDHVLLITIDTLRPDYLSCYGSNKVETPNIDRLASSGVIFKDTVVTAPVTLTSHVSILTGLIPPAHGVHDNGTFYVSKKIETLAKIFHANGFHTAAFVGAFPLDSHFGLDQGFDVYDDNYPTKSNVSELLMPERKASEVVDSAIYWLHTQNQARWFAWVHVYDPHFPYAPPESFRKRYAKDLYAGEVAYVDQQIGRLLSSVQNTGNKTLVVLTADHGESLGEHHESTHSVFAYESTLRVPLIIAPFAHSVVASRVRSIDIAPTILDLQKLAFSNKVQGVSLQNFLKDPHEAHTADSYFEALSMQLSAGWAPLRGFYSGNFKYIDLPIPELYDLSADPRESNNLCKNPELCKSWAARFTSFTKPFDARTVSPSAADPETVERLRALGYVAGHNAPIKKRYEAKDDPKNLIGMENRLHDALTYFYAGDNSKALKILDEIIKERPDSGLAYSQAAFIWEESGSPEKARDVLKKAIDNGVTDAEIVGEYGSYSMESGNYEESIRALKLALQKDPRNIDHWNDLGIAYKESGKLQDAEQAFHKALDLDRSDSMTLQNLGTLFVMEKRLNEAIPTFEAALARNPHNASAYNGLGTAYAMQNNFGKAIYNWQQALKENNKHYDAMLNLAYGYLETKENQKALVLLQQFEKEAPESKYSEDLQKVRSLISQLQSK